MFARRRVDAPDQAVGDESRIAGFELRHPRHDLALKIPRDRGGHTVKLHFALRAHRSKSEFGHAAFHRGLHGLSDARGNVGSLKATVIHDTAGSKTLR
jgi:hypothetical protein